MATLHVNSQHQNAYNPSFVKGKSHHKVNLRDVTILPRSEFYRIKDQLAEESIQDKKLKAEREQKAHLASESKKLVDTWTNTIAGIRAKKLAAKKNRLEKEEEELKQIDIEEAKYQAEKRKEILDKAKELQYWQTDRVKKLHSALTLTQVLHEREKQIEIKSRIRSADGKVEERYLKMRDEENQMAAQNDKKLAAKRSKENMENRFYITKQIQEKCNERDAEKLQDKLEGMKIQEAIKMYHDECNNIEKLKTMEKEQLRRDYNRHLSDKQLLEAIKRQNEEEENDKIRRFALAKREMAKIRAKKEKAMRDEGLRIRERQTEVLSEILNNMRSNEEEVLTNALEEKERKDAEENARKLEEQRKMFKSIMEHRMECQRLKDEEEIANKREAAEIRAARIKANEEMHQLEIEKKVNKFKRDKKFKDTQLKQYAEKREKILKEREEELVYDKRNVDIVELESQQFAEYAHGVIQEFKEKGVSNLYPLINAANTSLGGGHGPAFDSHGGVRPSYITSDKDGQELLNFRSIGAIEVKQDQSSKASTAKRLGFIWKK